MVCRIYISQLITEIAKLVNTLPTGKHLLVPMAVLTKQRGALLLVFLHSCMKSIHDCGLHHALLVGIHNSPSNSNRVLLCKLKDARAVSKV